MATRTSPVSEYSELQPFVLLNVRLTGTRIGAGAYGSVDEAQMPGALCAVKKIHDIFQDRSEIPAADIQRATTQFVAECKMMSTLRHPHIVQFLGVCFFTGSRLPALVMERLEISLHDLLVPENDEPQSKFLSLGLKCSILRDVARGLVYLHDRSPPIIHRDLSARNVLLNSAMVAKIADLGVARILPRMRAAATMTKAPGASIYMPPEACAATASDEEQSKYDASIDVFSLGVVAIFTLSQTFPCNLMVATYVDMESGLLKARTELERRGQYMQKIYSQLHTSHPLIQMIQQCLHNAPAKRPGIRQVLQLLVRARIDVRDEESDMNKLDLLHSVGEKTKQIEALQEEVETRNRVVGELQQQLAAKDKELSQAQETLQQHLRQKATLPTEQPIPKPRVANTLPPMQKTSPPTKPEGTEAAQEGLTAVTIYDYQAGDEEDLTFDENERITNIEQIDEGWWRGTRELDGSCGLFPANYVELETIPTEQPIPKPRVANTSPPMQKGLTAVTTFAYKAECEGELTFNENERITNIEQIDEGWWRGITELDGSFGLFPANYVKLLQLTVRCHTRKTAPRGMSRGAAAIHQSSAYFTPHGSKSVYRYATSEDKWFELPQCPFENSGLVVIDGVLTAVGGWDGYHRTKKLVTLQRGKWVEDYPAMNTARSFPTVVRASPTEVIVIGGMGDRRSWITAVELLQIGNKSWFQLTCLPTAPSLPSATLCGSQLYVIDRNNINNYSCSLQVIYTNMIPHELTWTRLPRLPANCSTAATFCGQLVIVGGMKENIRTDERTCPIHQLIDGEWVEIGSLSTARQECLVASVSADQMVVVGGEGELNSVELCVATS